MSNEMTGAHSDSIDALTAATIAASNAEARANDQQERAEKAEAERDWLAAIVVRAQGVLALPAVGQAAEDLITQQVESVCLAAETARDILSDYEAAAKGASVVQ